jgi:hypothetical protein
VNRALKTKTKGIVLLLAIGLASIGFALVRTYMYPATPTIPQDRAIISLNAAIPSITIDVSALDSDYMCLTSAEYDQLFLVREYDCFPCFSAERMTEESFALRQREWIKDRLLLAIRKGDSFDLQDIDLSAITSREIDNTYNDVRRSDGSGPDWPKTMAQCTRSKKATAYCYTLPFGACRFLFGSKPEGERVKE